jgi:hypothetical protein
LTIRAAAQELKVSYRQGRRIYRSRRERRVCFGELIQFDGSRHDRFEGRGSRCCLITMIDDATNIRYAQFFEAETTAGATGVLSCRIRKLRFRGNTEYPERCIATIKMPLCSSPQAKSRAERNHGLDQGRMVAD